MLKDYWKVISNYRGDLQTKSACFVRNETELMPFRYSQGRWQSYNSDDKNLLTIAEYIRQLKPDTILECGTFEARTTEYMTRLMRLCNSHSNKTIVTVDIPGCILHMDNDGEGATFQEEEGWDEVIKIRNARLTLLTIDPFVKVIYREGLTQKILPELMQEFSFDFIYEDASHLPGVLVEDFKHISSFAKKGCVVCFDDMAGNEFKDWIFDNVLGDWDAFYSDLERGQVWMEKL